jgi:hypothetical protein
MVAHVVNLLAVSGSQIFCQNVLRAFAKFQTAAVSFVMSACPPVRMEELGSHRTDFYEF